MIRIKRKKMLSLENFSIPEKLLLVYYHHTSTCTYLESTSVCCNAVILYTIRVSVGYHQEENHFATASLIAQKNPLGPHHPTEMRQRLTVIQ